MRPSRYRTFARNMILMLGSVAFSLVIFEIGLRFLDPAPFFPESEINNTEHGNLSMYDETLGWKGVPSGQAEFVTRNNRVWLAHNSHGFRDIEHDSPSDEKPAIVFLGDSFTWGYEVEFEELFVNRLREKFPGYTMFNLAHRGYGTDQAYLTFKRWRDERPLRLVVLMFSENDVADNNSAFSSRKPKPRFLLHNNELVLTGAPVPKDESWVRRSDEGEAAGASGEAVKTFFYRSHLVNTIRIRLKLLRQHRRVGRAQGSTKELRSTSDYTVTSRLLHELRTEVMRRGSRFVVVFIPSKLEIDELDDSPPYQTAIAEFCEELGIEYFDLAPALKKAMFRTYYLQGMHWTPHGHAVAAEALYDFLREELRNK